MKKKIIDRNKNESGDSAENLLPAEELINDKAEDISIEEYIKIKKLQNQILGKMLKKISHPETSAKDKLKNNQ
jgi:hypothetical protein